MRVLTLKTQTPANIKFPGYLYYKLSTISIELPEYTEKTHAWNANYANIYTYIYIGNLWIESALASLAQLSLDLVDGFSSNKLYIDQKESEFYNFNVTSKMLV